MFRIAWLLSGLLLVCSFASAARAGENYRDEKLRFDFDLPKGWTKWPASAVEQANKFARSRMGGYKVRYTAGFMPRGARLGSYPYILVQPHDGQSLGSSYEAIEQRLASESNLAVREVQRSLSDVARDISVGSLAVDRNKNRVVMRFQLTGPDGRKIDGMSLCMLGKNKVVTLHFYDYSERFPQSVETFLLSAHTFSFDQGHRFTPSSTQSMDMPPMLSSTLRGAAIGGVMGLALAALSLALRPRKKTSPESVDFGWPTESEPRSGRM